MQTLPIRPRGAEKISSTASIEEKDSPIIDPTKVPVFRNRIHGVSMEPTFPDGCLVEWRSVQCGQKLKVGKSYFIQKGRMATFKRLKRIKGDVLTFCAINREKYPNPIIIKRQELVFVARAEFIVMRPLDWMDDGSCTVGKKVEFISMG